MSWEAVSAIAAVLGLLLVIVQQLRALNRGQIAKAMEEAKAKEHMRNRIDNLERQLTEVTSSLADNTRHLWKAIETLRIEMPRTIGRAIADNLPPREHR